MQNRKRRLRMVDLWYFLVCAMFAAYVVLDGYDLGAGILSPFVAKDQAEKKAVLHTILPFWDGNEVFLVAGGATLYLAFPRLFPAFVSGFYLPVMMVLWLLALRGLGIEMRHKIDQPLWNQLWDGAFFFSSLMLVFFFGAAIGNVVRGVSVDDHGDFFAPLWTNFMVGEECGILDWYTLLVGITAVVLVAWHGATRLVLHCEDPVKTRAADMARKLYPAVVGFGVLSTIATFRVRTDMKIGVIAVVSILLALAGIALARIRPALAFQGSSATLVGFFGCACAAVHPYGLYARVPSRSVLAVNAAADAYALRVGLAWWLPGMAAVIAYSVFAHRKAGR